MNYIREFVKRYVTDWLSLLFGPLALVFTAYGVYVSKTTYNRLLFTGLLVLGLVISSYRVWKKEYLRTIPVAPAEPTILEKLVWPLRHAKGSYALGSYLSCIALCGMVGEMVALLLWEISKVNIQNKPLDEAGERALLGNTFEKLGQERRTQVLRAFDRIDAETKSAFDTLREIRRRYLHFLFQPHEQVATDARTAYEQALRVVAVVLGVAFEEGAVALRPDLMEYLTDRGLVEDEVNEAGA